MSRVRGAAFALLALATVGRPHGLEFGARIFTYRILEPLAEAGDRAVYIAYEPKAQRLVRLEILESRRGGALRRFRRAAEALRLLDHPGIQSYRHSGMDRGHFFLATPFDRGRTLETILRAQGSVEPLMSCRIAWKLAKALAHAHEMGVVTQGITPADVTITNARVVLFTGLFQKGKERARDQEHLGALLRQLLGEGPAKPSVEAVLKKLTAREYPAMTDAVADLEELSR